MAQPLEEKNQPRARSPPVHLPFVLQSRFIPPTAAPGSRIEVRRSCATGRGTTAITDGAVPLFLVSSSTRGTTDMGRHSLPDNHAAEGRRGHPDPRRRRRTVATLPVPTVATATAVAARIGLAEEGNPKRNQAVLISGQAAFTHHAEATGWGKPDLFHPQRDEVADRTGHRRRRLRGERPRGDPGGDPPGRHGGGTERPRPTGVTGPGVPGPSPAPCGGPQGAGNPTAQVWTGSPACISSA